MMKRLLCLFLLAACTQAQTPQPTPVPPAAEDTCNASEYAMLVGEDATTLERVLLLGKVRVIRPGQPVTMDFLPDRINFMINARNEIAQITCG